MAIGWTLRAMGDAKDSRERLREMARAGVMAGFDWGVKSTAAPMLLVLIPVAFALAMIIRGQGRLIMAPTIIFIACGFAAYSPWLIRNWVWARNPVFPEAMSILGRGHFSAE